MEERGQGGMPAIGYMDSSALASLSTRSGVSPFALGDVALFAELTEQRPLTTMSYRKDETVVSRGWFNLPPRTATETFTYSTVPLAIVVSGGIVVTEKGRVVKHLGPGDLVGLFEAADFINSGYARQVGRWTLVTDRATVLAFPTSPVSSFREHSRAAKKLVERARRDPLPQELSDLPLGEVSGRTDAPLLDDTVVVAHTHLLPSNLGLFRHLAKLVDHGNVYVLEKPDSVRHVYDEIIGMGADVVPVLHIAGAPHELGLRRGLALLWDRVVHHAHQCGIRRIVIVDDGADVILSVPWERLEGIRIGAVEQSTLGIEPLSGEIEEVIEVRLDGVGKQPVKAGN